MTENYEKIFSDIFFQADMLCYAACERQEMMNHMYKDKLSGNDADTFLFLLN